MRQWNSQAATPWRPRLVLSPNPVGAPRSRPHDKKEQTPSERPTAVVRETVEDEEFRNVQLAAEAVRTEEARLEGLWAEEDQELHGRREPSRSKGGTKFASSSGAGTELCLMQVPEFIQPEGLRPLSQNLEADGCDEDEAVQPASTDSAPDGETESGCDPSADSDAFPGSVNASGSGIALHVDDDMDVARVGEDFPDTDSERCFGESTEQYSSPVQPYRSTDSANFRFNAAAPDFLPASAFGSPMGSQQHASPLATHPIASPQLPQQIPCQGYQQISAGDGYQFFVDPAGCDPCVPATASSVPPSPVAQQQLWGGCGLHGQEVGTWPPPPPAQPPSQPLGLPSPGWPSQPPPPASAPPLRLLSTCPSQPPPQSLAQVPDSTSDPSPSSSRASPQRGSSEGLSASSRAHQARPGKTTSLKQVRAGACTTLMIRNLPKSVRRDMLEKELCLCGFSGHYVDVHVKANKGYAFVVFVSAQAAAALRVLWHRSRRFCGRDSDLALDISTALRQGPAQTGDAAAYAVDAGSARQAVAASAKGCKASNTGGRGPSGAPLLRRGQPPSSSSAQNIADDCSEQLGAHDAGVAARRQGSRKSAAASNGAAQQSASQSSASTAQRNTEGCLALSGCRLRNYFHGGACQY